MFRQEEEAKQAGAAEAAAAATGEHWRHLNAYNRRLQATQSPNSLHENGDVCIRKVTYFDKPWEPNPEQMVRNLLYTLSMSDKMHINYTTHEIYAHTN